MPLSYRPNLEYVVERHGLLWTRRLPHGILATIEPEEAPLAEVSMAACEAAPDIDAMIDIREEGLRKRRDLRDDSIPVARVSLGSDAFPGYLGAQVSFGGGGGWSKPLLTDWSSLDTLCFDENSVWIRWQRQACKRFVQRAEGRFGLYETETIDALNLAAMLRGPTQALLDIYEHPQELRRLMAFGVDFNIRFIEMQREILGPAMFYGAGMFNSHCVWLPRRAVWLSVDNYSLCRPEVFVRFGHEFLQQLVDHFGGGWLHLHAVGLYLLPEVLKLRRLLGISIQEDPGQDRPFERLDEIRAITGSLPLEIWCHQDELLAGIRSRTLPGGILYRVNQVKTVDEANGIMAQVREYEV